MNDYISRSDLERKAVKMYGFGEAKYVSLNTIQAAPAADVAPVVHARWVPGPLYLNILCQEYKCSICGRTLLLGNSKSLDEYPYCHCGAKMDEEETNG